MKQYRIHVSGGGTGGHLSCNCCTIIKNPVFQMLNFFFCSAKDKNGNAKVPGRVTK
jgi:hypothetical protein